MTLTTTQALLIALAVTAGAMLTRFLPFLLFPDNRPVPKIVSYLGRTLPAAMMGLLVVYCLRNVSVTTAPYGLPELISIAVLAAFHLWKRNVLLSIGVGTVLYMVLVQVVFGFVCASPAPIGMVIADIALKSAGVELIKTLRPDSGTSHSNEVIIIFTGEASAVKTAVTDARSAGMQLLRSLGSEPLPVTKPYI